MLHARTACYSRVASPRPAPQFDADYTHTHTYPFALLSRKRRGRRHEQQLRITPCTRPVHSDSGSLHTHTRDAKDVTRVLWYVPCRVCVVVVCTVMGAELIVAGTADTFPFLRCLVTATNRAARQPLRPEDTDKCSSASTRSIPHLPLSGTSE